MLAYMAKLFQSSYNHSMSSWPCRLQFKIKLIRMDSPSKNGTEKFERIFFLNPKPFGPYYYQKT